MFTEEIKKSLERILPGVEISLEHPADLKHGDYSTNVALAASKLQSFKVSNPKELAGEIVKKWQTAGLPDFVEKIKVAGVGFINIWLKFDALGNQLSKVLRYGELFGKNNSLAGRKIMVEFAHPNTHKELHVGHMRTLITGEALSRIFSACGAEVFRANYQGDIGPHVAKAIWGTEKILTERGISWDKAEKLSLTQKAHLLGEGYVRGNQDYEKFEKEIDELNVKLYKKDPRILLVYERTRRWSLQYYDSFYSRFLTKFDRLFFESEVADEGKKIVLDNIGKVFAESEGAVIFDGEPFDLHKRVFITANGTPTYEAKEMALAQAQYKAFPFDLNVHVVANEQTGYFQVVIKAIELLFPNLKGRECHLPMGMVNLVGRKMSSRTGVILRVDDLIEEVKSYLKPLVKLENANDEEKAGIAEVGTIAAIKYSVLRVGPKANVAFDPEKSVSLQGDSGIYLEYTYARTCSVLANSRLSLRAKPCTRRYGAKRSNLVGDCFRGKPFAMTEEEMSLLRTLCKFPEVVEQAGEEFSPNILCNFLFDLAQKFNLFYDKQRIIGSERQDFRLALTAGVGQVLKNGLNLLGIEALERM